MWGIGEGLGDDKMWYEWGDFLWVKIVLSR